MNGKKNKQQTTANKTRIVASIVSKNKNVKDQKKKLSTFTTSVPGIKQYDDDDDEKKSGD